MPNILYDKVRRLKLFEFPDDKVHKCINIVLFCFLVISIDEESPAEECVVAVQQSMTVWVASIET